MLLTLAHSDPERISSARAPARCATSTRCRTRPGACTQVAKDAYRSALNAAKVNRHLAEAGENFQLPTAGYEALAHVAELLSRRSEPRAEPAA
jgi:hypothetical protein